MDVFKLTAEAESILNAPYPTSLRNLHTILSHPSSTPVVQTWTKLKQCQISPLLDVLSSRIDTDRSAEACLLLLLTSKDVFDIFVQTMPKLLEAVCARQISYLTTRSSTTASGSEPVQETVPHLLHVLPASISPPASYFLMLESLITYNDTESYGSWQERSYDFLSNASFDTLSQLSEDTMKICVHHWTTSMRSQNCVESLYAAYIASRVQRHVSSIFVSDSSLGSGRSVGPTLRAWLEKCNAIFRGGAAVETVRNTLARILKLACDDRCRALPHAADAIVLAKNALDVALVNYESDWIKDTAPYTRKLSQKFANMPEDLQLASLDILAPSDIRQLVPDVAQVLRTMFTHVISSCRAESSSASVLLRIMHRCIDPGVTPQTTHAFAGFFQELATFIIEQCRPQRPATEEKMHCMRQALNLVKSLQQEDGSSDLARSLLQAFTIIGLPEWWPLNLSTPGSPENCSGLHTCVHRDESLRQDLADKVSLLLLTTAAGSGHQLSEDQVKLTKQRLSWSGRMDVAAVCCYHPFVAQQHSVLTSEPEPNTNANWRDHLKDSVRASGTQITQLVEQTIMTVTRDLQDRCENIERPLREARQECEQLREHIQLIQTRLASTVAEKESLQEALVTEQRERGQLTAANNELQQSSSDLQQELVGLQSQLKNLQTELANAETRHQEALQDAEKKSVVTLEDVKFKHTTRTAELEALLSSQAQAASALESETAWLKQQMEVAKKEMEEDHRRKLDEIRHRFEDEEAQLQEQIDSLRRDLASRDERIEKLNSDIGSKDHFLSEMKQENKTASASIARLESDLSTEEARIEELSNELTVAQETSEKLAAELAARDSELEDQGERLAEMENTASHWQKRYVAAEETLAKARERETGIQELLLGGFSTEATEKQKAVTKGRRATSAAVTRQNTSTPAAPPRLPTGSFLSQSTDTDYLEVMKYGQ